MPLSRRSILLGASAAFITRPALAALQLPQSPLAFPGGPPSINPAHPLSAGARFVAVATSNQLFNLVNGKPTTASGSVTGTQTITGPAISATGAANQLTAIQASEALTSLIMSAIYTPTSSVAFSTIINNSSTNFATANTTMLADTLILKLFINGGQLLPGFLMALNTPYYIIMSVIAGSGGFFSALMLNLKTGAISTNTASGAITIATPTPNYNFGGPGGGGLNGLLSAASVTVNSKIILTPGQLIALARRPYSLWYPQISQQLMLSDAVTTTTTGGNLLLRGVGG